MTKTITVSGSAVTLKADGDVAGEVSSVFATLDVIDKDNDVMLPKSIGDQRVLMSAYGHASWGGMFSGAGPMPIGKGRIFERGNEAVFEGNMDVADPDVLKTFKRMQFLGDQQEWSFSLDDVKASPGERDGKVVSLISDVKVYEVSPVFLGSGINTRLLSAKSNDPDLQREIVRLTADVDAKAADIERLNAELKQERNATARGLFQVAAL